MVPFPHPEQDFPVLLPVLDDLTAGRLDGAEQRVLRLLDGVRGTQSVFERDCCHALAVVYAHGGRHLEGLLFAARSVELARAAGDLGRLAQSLSHFAVSLERLSLYGRLRESVEQLDRVLDAEPELLDSTAGALAQHLRLRMAIHDGDELTARLVLRNVLASSHPPETVKLSARASLAELAGDWSGALALWSTEPTHYDHHGPRHFQERRARVLARMGRMGDAAEQALLVVESLEADAAEGRNAQLILDEAVRAGRLCAEILQRPALATRCFDLAATSTMRRIVELEAISRRLPELHQLSATETALVQEVRAAAVEQQSAISRYVSEGVSAQELSDRFLQVAGATAGDCLTICAWCDRVQNDAAQWVPVGHFLPRSTEIRVSHGICPPCQDRVLQEAEVHAPG